MTVPGRRRPGTVTLGADKACDAAGFVMELGENNVTPDIAPNTGWRASAFDRRTARHGGYGASQRIRRRIEAGVG